MQSTKDRLGNDSALLRGFDAPRYWSVVIKRLMRARGVVVVDVFGEDPSQVRFAEKDDMIEAFTADRSDHPLSERVLPGRTWRDHDFLDSHVLEPLLEAVAVDAIAITDQMLRSLVEGEGLDDLLCGPCRGRMGGDIEVDEPASVMSEHDEAVEHAERNRVNGEEVDRGDVFDVILQE